MKQIHKVSQNKATNGNKSQPKLSAVKPNFPLKMTWERRTTCAQWLQHHSVRNFFWDTPYFILAAALTSSLTRESLDQKQVSVCDEVLSKGAAFSKLDHVWVKSLLNVKDMKAFPILSLGKMYQTNSKYFQENSPLIPEWQF